MKTIISCDIKYVFKDQESSEILKGFQCHILERGRSGKISARVQIRGTILIRQLITFQSLLVT